MLVQHFNICRRCLICTVRKLVSDSLCTHILLRVSEVFFSASHRNFYLPETQSPHILDPKLLGMVVVDHGRVWRCDCLWNTVEARTPQIRLAW